MKTWLSNTFAAFGVAVLTISVMVALFGLVILGAALLAHGDALGILPLAGALLIVCGCLAWAEG